MASLTFTVVTQQRRNRNSSRRPQRTQDNSGVKTSAAWRRRTTSQRKPRKTFCKVCFDAGKSESLYTNHFVKDRPGPNGKVVCPTLLSTECRYCHDHGHFKSHCPVLATRLEKIEQEARAQQEKSWLSAEQRAFIAEKDLAHKMSQQQKKEEKQPVTAAVGGAFAALDSDTSDDEQDLCYARPTVAQPRSPQGVWGNKPVAKPTYDLSLQCDEELSSTTAQTRSVEDIEADLKDSRKELSFIGDSWADAADREELEENISELEDELAKLKSESTKDQFGRPAADGSAW